uniref:ribosomal protein S3 n=1 Tax=Apopellia endiviifolia TaxID=304445 RepID=UPI00257BC720|nr:ribosomal protein S3 [Apopellia endiviifolia]WIA66173.1 ribosomal protein S3 [Apopellia endiviifolia]WIA66214.1 ribosomal protein S3 [Apopellia endiviifolia]
MAQKVNPISVRLNLNRSSDSSWFSDYYYGKLLYQDLNFRDYFGSIRPPTGNTFGFRLGRCIIHHFPKRTFIHVFFLDRLSPSRQGPSETTMRINTVKQKRFEDLGIWKKREYDPSIQIDQLLRVSDCDIHSTFRDESIWPTQDRAERYDIAFSRFASPAVRADIDVCGRAFLDYFVMQYFFNLKNQILRFDASEMVKKGNRSPKEVATSVSKGAIALPAGRESRSTLYFDAIIFFRYARFRKATSRPSYLRKMQSLFSNRTKTNTLIQPVKIAPVYQSASPIAQEISWKLEQKKSFRQICRSIFKQIKKCPYVKGIRIGCSGRLNGAEIAKTECKKYGETSLHVFSDQIDYAKTQASTPYGILGVKVWVSYFLTQKKGTN